MAELREEILCLAGPAQKGSWQLNLRKSWHAVQTDQRILRSKKLGAVPKGPERDSPDLLYGAHRHPRHHIDGLRIDGSDLLTQFLLRPRCHEARSEIATYVTPKSARK